MSTEVRNGIEQPQKALKVFISYSRKDIAFVRRLADELLAQGYEPDYDQATHDPDNIDSGISAEDEWWQRLQQMIAAADVMVFVISPNSAASKVCDEEIAYARGIGKRTIPVLLHAIDFNRAPPRLSALNAKIDFKENDGEAFATALCQLRNALDKDVRWYRENRRLTELAVRWDARGRPDELLLARADTRAIGECLENKPKDAPEPFAALLELRDKSRAKLDDDDRKQRRTIGRAFVKPAEEALARGEYEHALRLAAAGVLLAQDIESDLVPELSSPLARAMFHNRTRAVLKGHDGRMRSAIYSPNPTFSSIISGMASLVQRVCCTAGGKRSRA